MKKLAVVMREMKGSGPFDRKYYLGKAYLDMLEDCGASVWPILSERNIEDAVAFCDGLLIPGSPNDTHPSYYGEEVLEGKTTYEVDEYALDKAAIKAFLAAGKKILGICAGLQELNVYYGGSLYQKIEGHSEGRHPVCIDKGSRLYEIYNKEEITVNSWHSQAVKRLGEGLKVTALSRDGIVEAFENDQVLAVQWHPEMIDDREFFVYFLEKVL
ncbi:MAG: gamma-glutamyl-gamma-aminobutyrate hydrolase family protein [Erysipelotrichaceae bacterium]|nr:gamma-glutamyl-gamma-aminobutyrate hydrolase family protein [Erysipelotrichaceae bacterium]